jgi:hypothetical protein
LILRGRLTFYSDDNPKLTRWVEHLSPRFPKEDKQRIHVVLYTDDQLKKANLSVLFSEAQQLEQSVFAWKWAKPEFKERYGRFFSRQLVEKRRDIIYSAWPEAAKKDNVKWGGDIWYDRLSAGGPLAREMVHLPP